MNTWQHPVKCRMALRIGINCYQKAAIGFHRLAICFLFSGKRSDGIDLQ